MRGFVKRLYRHLRRRAGPVILMYHRIATPKVDPWGLAVSPQHFAEHLRVLRANRTILSMDELVARLHAGNLPGDAVALTFDDGYLDNLRQAKPILETAGVPATVFLTTGRIGKQEEFWWDELARMVLCHPEPVSAGVTLEGEKQQIELPPATPETERRVTWRAWDKPESNREATYQGLWRALRDCSPERRVEAMAQLRRIFGTERPNPEDLPMSEADVREIVSDSITVGAHGCTHQPLTSLEVQARLEEIERSRVEAQSLSTFPVTGFAYPHGDRDAETIGLVRQAGYGWACSTNETAIRSREADLHDLPRIAVRDWRADQLLRKLDSLG